MVRYRIEVDGTIVEEREVLPDDDAAARADAIRAGGEHARRGHAVAVYRSGAGWVRPR